MGGVFDRLIGTDVQGLTGGKGGVLSLVPTSQEGINRMKKTFLHFSCSSFVQEGPLSEATTSQESSVAL